MLLEVDVCHLVGFLTQLHNLKSLFYVHSLKLQLLSCNHFGMKAFQRLGGEHYLVSEFIPHLFVEEPCKQSGPAKDLCSE